MIDERTAKLQSLNIDREDASAERRGAPWAVVAGAAVIAALLGAGAGWMFAGDGSGGGQAATPPPPPPPARTAENQGDSPAVSTTQPRRGSGLVASGYVVARRQATVSAEITGTIEDVLIEEGAQVEDGDVLARLDDTRAQLDLALNEANREAARSRIGSLQAQLEEARLVADRAGRLAESNYSSRAAVSAAESQRDSLDAQLRSARAELAAAEVRVESQRDYIDRHIVRAPFAGVVIAKNAQVGEILSPVSAGGGFTRTGIATLVDMASLEIEVDVNEGQIQRVEPGQRVEAVLDAYPDWTIPARVEAIIPTADRARATIKVRVALEERDQRVLPDMAARVTFIEERGS